jgi:hypothetical protein
MCSVWDVAAKAIEINGPTGENEQLRRQRAQKEQDHVDKAAKVAEDQARKAKLLTPTTPEEKLCKKKGLTPKCTLDKKRALKTFNLTCQELDDMALPFQRKPTPTTQGGAP